MSLLVIFTSPHACGNDPQEDFLHIVAEYLEVVSVMIVLSYIDFICGPVYELISVVETEHIHYPSI